MLTIPSADQIKNFLYIEKDRIGQTAQEIMCLLVEGHTVQVFDLQEQAALRRAIYRCKNAWETLYKKQVKIHTHKTAHGTTVLRAKIVLDRIDSIMV